MNKAVILGGMPRSGTNLLRRLIGSHSEIAMPPVEFMFYQGLTSGRKLRGMLGDERFQKRYGLDVTDLLDQDENPKLVYQQLLKRYAAGMNKPIMGEKSPRNEFHYSKIVDSLPDHRVYFAQIVRNPLDVAASFKHAPFRRSASSTHGFDSELIKLCNDWVRGLGIGLSRMFAKPDAYRVVKYERLTSSPASEVESLADFLEVERETGRMLRLADFSSHGDNTSFAKEKVEDQSDDIGKVKPAKSRKDQLTESERVIVGEICGEHARAFGYNDKEFDTPVSAVSRRHSSIGNLGGRIKAVARHVLR